MFVWLKDEGCLFLENTLREFYFNYCPSAREQRQIQLKYQSEAMEEFKVFPETLRITSDQTSS